ncbi:MAG: insulinase family protein [Planctomycetota bacterium]|nr:MAG: insulinase family protein [Planctomycetota bacterium]
MKFHHHRLSNGLDVLAEINPAAYSVAYGFFVRTGARDETPDVSGVSHFLEHMVFKGTPRHSAEDVNRIFDEIGAIYNASTSEEETAFYAATLPEYFPVGFELLADIMFPSLHEEDFRTEKQVILEEIAMYDDQPASFAVHKAMETHFAGHPLANPILGTRESITALPVEAMRRYHRERYRTGNVVLAVSGNIEWDLVRRLAEEKCGHWPKGSFRRAHPPRVGRRTDKRFPRADLVQQHTVMMCDAPGGTDRRRIAASVLSFVVGQADNSRLYWELVDPGRAESADLSFLGFDGVGAFIGYLSCAPEDAEANATTFRRVLKEVTRYGITQEELQRAVNKLSTGIVLRGELPAGRLGAIASEWMYHRRYRSVDDEVKDLQRLSVADVAALLEQFPLDPETTVVVAPEQTKASRGAAENAEAVPRRA